MALSTVHSAMSHLINKYSITASDGSAVTIEHIMSDTEMVTKLTDAMGKSSGRRTTEPNAPFDIKICKCRIYEKSGLPKQCPNAIECGDICKTHNKKIGDTDEKVWQFGFYNDELPSELLSGKNKGKSISWKVDGYEPKRRASPSSRSKGEHPRPKGRSPKGMVWDGENGEWTRSLHTDAKGRRPKQLPK